MSTADTYIRARIDTNTKERATAALQAMGLSMSDAIRLLMLRVADERRLPFDIKMPNSASHQAVTVHNAHNGKRSARIEASAANRHPAD